MYQLEGSVLQHWKHLILYLEVNDLACLCQFEKLANKPYFVQNEGKSKVFIIYENDENFTKERFPS